MSEGDELHFEINPDGWHVEFLLIKVIDGEERETEGQLTEVDIEVPGLLDRI